MGGLEVATGPEANLDADRYPRAGPETHQESGKVCLNVQKPIKPQIPILYILTFQRRFIEGRIIISIAQNSDLAGFQNNKTSRWVTAAQRKKQPIFIAIKWKQ